MAFFDKLKDKTNDLLEISKLNGKINDEKSKIEANKSKLAEYYWAKFESGEMLDSEAMEYCAAIQECNAAIANFSLEIVKIKEEPPVVTPVEAQPSSPVVEAEGGATERLANCPACGTEIKLSKKFCPDCGTPIPPPAPIVEVPKVEVELKPSYCTSCGNLMAVGRKFCSECGTAVK